MKTEPGILAASTLNSVSRRRSGVGRVFKPGRLFNRRLRNSPAITRTWSPVSTHLHQAVTALPVFADVGDGQPQFVLRRWSGDERLRFRTRQFEHLFIANDIGDAQRGKSRLLGAEEFAWTAQFQIHLSNVEAVGG